MHQRVIVGVTDAAACRRALDWAADRAAARGDAVQLVSIVGGAVGTVGEGPVVDDALRSAGDLLEREAENLRARGVDVQTHVGRGNPVEQLLELSHRAELLVIGSDYRGPQSGPSRGPHGTRIASRAACPVAVVPDLDLTGREGVVVGVDGSEISEAAIAFAAAEADRAGEPLIAVSTWTPVTASMGDPAHPEEYLQTMQTMTDKALAVSVAGIAERYPDLVVRTVTEGSDRPDMVINRVAAEARLAVVGSHGRGRIARFLLGSTSEKVLARLATATVVVR